MRSKKLFTHMLCLAMAMLVLPKSAFALTCDYARVFQIIGADSCLVKITEGFADTLVHVTGIDTTKLADNERLPRNNLFWTCYGSTYNMAVNRGRFRGDIITRPTICYDPIEHEIRLKENGTYAYTNTLGGRSTIKSYVYEPFVPMTPKKGEPLTYCGEKMSDDEIRYLWKFHAAHIYRGKKGFSSHGAYLYDPDGANVAYRHVTKDELLFYLVNGGQVYVLVKGKNGKTRLLPLTRQGLSRRAKAWADAERARQEKRRKEEASKGEEPSATPESKPEFPPEDN